MSLGSGSATRGGSVSLNLSLNTSGSAPAGVQWTASYPASDVASVNATAGAALTAAGKSLTCNASGGTIICLTSGMNSSVINSGVVAVLQVTLTSTGSASSISLPLSNVMGALPDGTLAAVSGSGGTVTATAPTQITASSLQCSPSTVASGGAASCTVTISAGAASGGATVALSSNNAALAVPGSVSIAAGSSTGTFTATAGSVNSTQAVTLSASLNGKSATAAASVVPAGTATGLVAAYAFSEGSGTTVADLSGNGNTGTIQGATWSTAGKYGSALQFDGASTWVTINDSSSLDLTSGMTLEAWVNPTTLTGSWRTVLLKEQNGAMVYALYAQTDTDQPSGHVYTNTEYDTRGPGLLPTGAWTHLAATYNGATLSIFVNGVLASSKTVVGNILTSGGVLRIGGNSIWDEYFSGLIDEVRVYNRPLSAAEIQADMSAGIGVAPPPVAVTVTVSALQCAPASIAPGATSSCTVTLSNAAPTGGSSVALSSNNAALTVPASVTVAAGATSGTFTAKAGTVTANQTATVTASLNASSTTAAVTVTYTAPTMTTLQCSPASIASGATSSCTLTMSKAAPTGGSSVALSSNNAALTVPASVTVAAGATSGTFTAKAGTVTANQTATVTASYSAGSATAAVTVTAAAPPASTGLVAAYTFNEGAGTTVADSSGNGNTGTTVQRHMEHQRQVRQGALGSTATIAG